MKNRCTSCRKQSGILLLLLSLFAGCEEKNDFLFQPDPCRRMVEVTLTADLAAIQSPPASRSATVSLRASGEETAAFYCRLIGRPGAGTPTRLGTAGNPGSHDNFGTAGIADTPRKDENPENIGKVVKAGTLQHLQSLQHPQSLPYLQNVQSETTAPALFPDQLYNLEIQQYDQAGRRIGGMTDAVTQPAGSTLVLPLAESEDCQLVAVAWGEGNDTRLGTASLADVRQQTIPSSAISALDPARPADMNRMPYVLYLPHVKTTAGRLGSPEGKDVRLRLRRLAVRLNFRWNYTFPGYAIRQILLQSIPMNYAVVAAPDASTGTYPSLLDRFTTLQLSESDLAAGRYACWIPANVRGTNPAATSPWFRTKQIAPIGSSFVHFIAVDADDSKKKLDYRVYLGGEESSDFNLYENTDYDYQVAFIHTSLPVNDRRVTVIDPIPASENNRNFVPTANCFMIPPGGSFCFDPFEYRQNGISIPNQTLIDWCARAEEGGIASVKLLWQTRENGDVGDPVAGVVNAPADHTNIVDILHTDGTPVDLSTAVSEPGQARIYCRVAPGTTGGNAVIAACNIHGEIIWSWHLWITDYSPDASGDYTVLQPAAKRKQKYAGNGAADGYPLMDRNLGALAGFTELPSDPVEMSKANGLQYQRGRKDPFLSSYTQHIISAVEYDPGSSTPPEGLQNMYGPDGLTYVRRLGESTLKSYREAYKTPYTLYSSGSYWNTASSWNTTWNAAAKDLNDPCPAGWRIPSAKNFQALFEGSWKGSQSAVYTPRGVSDKTAFLQAGANNGYLLTYDEAGHKTYFRLTGYGPKVGRYTYIGTQGNILVCEYGSAFSFGSNTVATNSLLFNVNTATSSNLWVERDAHSVRCIQERAD